MVKKIVISTIVSLFMYQNCSFCFPVVISNDNDSSSMASSNKSRIPKKMYRVKNDYDFITSYPTKIWVIVGNRKIDINDFECEDNLIANVIYSGYGIPATVTCEENV